MRPRNLEDNWEAFAYAVGFQEGWAQRRGRVLDLARLTREEDRPLPPDARYWLTSAPAPSEIPPFAPLGLRRWPLQLLFLLTFGNTLYVSTIRWFGNTFGWLDGGGVSAGRGA